MVGRAADRRPVQFGQSQRLCAEHSCNLYLVAGRHGDDNLRSGPLVRRTVQVERVAINRVVDGELPVRYEGDTMIILILEEVLVVEKRLMLKEELHVTQHHKEFHQPQRIVLRNEDITVERLAPNDRLPPERVQDG